MYIFILVKIIELYWILDVAQNDGACSAAVASPDYTHRLHSDLT